MSSIKQSIRSALRGLGVEVHRFNPAANKTARLIASLSYCSIDTVLDIGANEGQFAQELRTGGYRETIVSFEPMADAHSKLLVRSQGDSKWHVAARAAIGAGHGTVELNVAGNSVSSSVLPMLEARSKAAPDSVYRAKEPVALMPLDEAAIPFVKNSNNILLKIDTQGYEWQVLDGAADLMTRSRAVLIELSLLPLYEGQRLWMDYINRLEAAGLTLWALEPAFVDSESGRTMQLDGLFIRI